MAAQRSLVCCAVALLALLASPAAAVRAGDEQFEGEANGVFVVPADLAISFIDPKTQQVVKNITEFNGTALLGPDGVTPRKWSDAIYAENPEKDQYYLFINEVDVYTDPDGSTYSHVTVVDTVQREIVARVRTGAALVHGYSVFEQNEFWAHSDAEGQFYVISLDEAGALASQPVKAFFDDPGHGKLLVDDRIYPTGYATNVNQQRVFEIDIKGRKLNNSYPFTATLCTGTHSIGFSHINLHLYIECIGGGGVIEWDTVTKKVVKQWNETFGAVYSTHDAESQYIIVSDGANNRAVIFQPDATGTASTLKYSVPVEGNPGHPVFYPKNDETNATTFAQYLVFFPLLNIVNTVNIQAVAALGNASLSVTDPGYAEQPYDCQYSPAASTESAGGQDDATPLMLAQQGGKPITPNCGSCAPQNPKTDFNASLSGFSYIDAQKIVTTDAVNQTANAGKLIPAGAILLPPAVGNDTNECSYDGEGSREGHRGGPHVAVYAEIPAPALYIVDASAAGGPKLLGMAPVGANPARTAWAPTRTYAAQRTADDSIVGGGVAPISGGPAFAPGLEVQSSGVAAAPDNGSSPAPAPADDDQSTGRSASAVSAAVAGVMAAAAALMAVS